MTDALSRICLIDDDAETLKEKIEKEDFVYRVVSEMKPPCSLLLKAHYWEQTLWNKKSPEIRIKSLIR